MKLRTTSLTIPTLDNNTPENTKIILHHYGNDYYFDKIWIQGKNYGYEFPLPNAVKSRMRERSRTLHRSRHLRTDHQERGDDSSAEHHTGARATTTGPGTAEGSSTEYSSTAAACS